MTCGDCDFCNSGDEHLCPSRELIGIRVPGAVDAFTTIDLMGKRPAGQNVNSVFQMWHRPIS